MIEEQEKIIVLFGPNLNVSAILAYKDEQIETEFFDDLNRGVVNEVVNFLTTDKPGLRKEVLGSKIIQIGYEKIEKKDTRYTDAVSFEFKVRGAEVTCIPSFLKDTILLINQDGLSYEDRRNAVSAIINLSDKDAGEAKVLMEKISNNMKELSQNELEWKEKLDSKAEEILNEEIEKTGQ